MRAAVAASGGGVLALGNMTTPEPEPRRSFREIKKCIAKCEKELEAIKSPRDAYDEKVAAVNANIRNSSQSLSGPSQTVNAQALEDIVAFGGKLKELEIKYKTTLKEEEASYQQKLEAAVRSLCDGLVATMGRSVVERSLRKLPTRESKQSNSSESQNTPADCQVIEVRTESVRPNILCQARPLVNTQRSSSDPTTVPRSLQPGRNAVASKETENPDNQNDPSALKKSSRTGMLQSNTSLSNFLQDTAGGTSFNVRSIISTSRKTHLWELAHILVVRSMVECHGTLPWPLSTLVSRSSAVMRPWLRRTTQ